jgi:hypothetical protein
MVYFNSNPNFMLSIYIGGYDVLLAEETRLPQEKHQKLLTSHLVTLVSSTNKTDCQDITEILLNVVLNTINLNLVLMNKLL